MNKLVKSLFCVTFFSVATRALGFLLKIYLSRRMSTELLGSYQVAMGVFGVLMTFVSSGIPVVLSRNVSYYYGKRDRKAIGSIVSSGLIITGIICCTTSVIILIFPQLLSHFFTSSASMQMIMILLPGLIFSSIYEVLRGALWGQKKFFAISFTEFLEQVARVIIIVILFETSFCKYSLTNKTALSLTLACVISTIVVIIIYIKTGGKISSPKQEFKGLLKTSTPITAVRTLSSAFSSVIAIIIPIKLMDFGYSSSEALSEFGIIMGMTFPLILVPSTLIGSLAVTVIPSISEQTKNIDDGKLKDVSALKSKINFVINVTIVFACILLPIFLSLGRPICNLIFKNEKAGVYLTASACLMLPLGLSQITTSVLNAIGLELKSLKNYIFSAILLILSVVFLPRFYGTYSLIIGYFLMSTSSSLLNIFMLKKRKIVDYSFLKNIMLMLIISLICTSVSYLTYLVFTGSLLALILAGAIATILMFGLIYLFDVSKIKVIIFDRKNSYV